MWSDRQRPGPLPATVVITEPFQGLVQSFAETLGAPGYQAVVVSHPISSKDAARLEVLAAQVANAAVRQLTPPD